MPLKPQNQLFIYLKIGQLNPHLFQLMLCRINCCIHNSLCPVLRCKIRGDVCGRACGGLDLIHHGNTVRCGKNAIGAAFQRKFNFFIRKNTAKKYLRGVIGMFFYSGALQFAVDACALIGAVKAGKAVVNAANPAQEFHQLAHRQRDLYWGYRFLQGLVLLSGAVSCGYRYGHTPAQFSRAGLQNLQTRIFCFLGCAAALPGAELP